MRQTRLSESFALENRAQSSLLVILIEGVLANFCNRRQVSDRAAAASACSDVQAALKSPRLAWLQVSVKALKLHRVVLDSLHLLAGCARLRQTSSQIPPKMGRHVSGNIA